MKTVFISGHGGMVGAALHRFLARDSSIKIVVAARSELDLCDQREVEKFFSERKIDEVYLAAAKVGGIHANKEYPTEFLYQNLMIQNNVIYAAHKAGVSRLMFLGSSCIYPKYAQQPITEESLLTGPLEPTNEPYAIAKIAGIKLCESLRRQYGKDFRAVMPTNLYGPGDYFNLDNAHVIPSLIRRFHEAKLAGSSHVCVWGTGKALREFLFVDDLASAVIHVMNLDIQQYEDALAGVTSHINIGYGADITIKALAESIAQIVEFSGQIKWDASKPDGTPRKLMSCERLRKTGWSPSLTLSDGLQQTYAWFLENEKSLRV